MTAASLGSLMCVAVAIPKAFVLPGHLWLTLPAASLVSFAFF